MFINIHSVQQNQTNQKEILKVLHPLTNPRIQAVPFPTRESRLIELRNVSKAYAVAAGQFLALKGINLYVDEGEFVAVVGKSGSGKSTLINVITGIDDATSGEVLVASTVV